MVRAKDIDKSVWIIFSIFTIFLFVVNVLFPTQSDSLGVPYGGIKAAINSYMNWNGRFGELMAVAVLNYISSSVFFAFLNSMVSILFTLSFFILIFGRLPQTRDDSVLIAIFIFCILAFSMFGSIFIWASGSLNYLWAYCGIVLVGLPYRIFWNQYIQINSPSFFVNIQSFETNMFLLSIFFIASFCAGMSNELGGIIAILFHFIFLFYGIFILKIKFPYWYYIGILLFILGYLALYFSPGQAIRIKVLIDKNSFTTISSFLNMSLYEKLFIIDKMYGLLTRTIIVIISNLSVLLFFIERYRKKDLISCLFPLFLLCSIYVIKYIHYFDGYNNIIMSLLVIVMYAYIFIIYKKEVNLQFQKIYFNFLCMFLFFYVIATSTFQVHLYFPNRSMLFVVLFGIFGFYCIYQIISILFLQHIIKIQYAIFTACLLYMFFVLSAYVDMRLKWNNMLSYIEQQKSVGVEHIVVDGKYFHSFYKRYGDWVNPGDNAETWPNTIYAKYFGVKTFIVK